MSVDIRNAQVKNLKVGPTIITEGLMSWWNAASVHSYPRTGSVWYDLVQNRNNGSLVNMSADNFTDDGGGALVFDGTDEYVSIPHDSSIDFGSGSFTVSLWVKFDPTMTGEGYLIGKRGITTSGNYAGWSLLVKVLYGTIWQLNGIVMANGSLTSTIPSYLSGFTPLDVWTPMSLTYDSSSGAIKFNVPNTDNSVTSTAITPPFGSIANSVPLEMLGTTYLNSSDRSPTVYSPIAASVANVVLYNRALTDDEIVANYSSTRGRFE